MKTDRSLAPRLQIAFVCVVLGTCLWMLFAASIPVENDGPLRWMPAGYQPQAPALAFGLIVFGLVAFSPWRPLLGAVAATLVAFGIARYRPQLEWAWASGFQESVLCLAASGMLLCAAVRTRLVDTWRTGLLWPRFLIAAIGWGLLTEVIARVSGDLDPGFKHHLVRMVESVLMTSMVFASVRRKRDFHVLLISASIGIGWSILQLPKIESASDLAFSCAFLACLIAGYAFQATLPVVLIGGATAFAMVLASVMTANRGANVGLVIGAIAVGLSRLRSFRSVSLVAFLMVMIGFAALNSPLRPRMQQWLDSGWETTTLASRLEFWGASLSLAPQRLFWGIGPGRGGQSMSESLNLDKWKATHNSPLEMLSEQGVMGLVLWVTLIALAFAACRQGISASQNWVNGLSVGVIGGLVAMLVAGMAISRHDDLRLFWILGLAYVAGSPPSQKRDEQESPN
jgi:hypothetical protein